MASVRRRRKIKGPSLPTIPQKLKLVRVDAKTQVEVPESMSDQEARDRYWLRKQTGPRSYEIPYKSMPEIAKEDIVPEEDIIPSDDPPDDDDD